MEVSYSSSSNMSLLDQIFGTDGRKRKDEGIWNWVKSQKNKSKHRSKAGPVVFTQSTSTIDEKSLHRRSESFNSSLSGSRSASDMSYTCSPSSPTSSFTPSLTSSSSISSSSSIPSSPTEITRSFTPPPGVSPRVHNLPHPRQRNQSSSAVSAHQQQQQPMYQSSYESQSNYTANGLLRRSMSSKSTRTSYSDMSQDSIEVAGLGTVQRKRFSTNSARTLVDISKSERPRSSLGDSTLMSARGDGGRGSTHSDGWWWE